MPDLYAPVSGERLVKTATGGVQTGPRTGGMEGGGHVVARTDQTLGSTDFERRGRMFDAAGAEVGQEFVATFSTSHAHKVPTIAALADLTPVHADLPATLYTVEDAPVGLNGGIAIDPPPSWISDPDSATVTTTLSASSGTFSVTGTGTAVVIGDGTGAVTITGSVADVNLAVYHASYIPPLDVYGSQEITVTTSDGTTSASDTIDVSISPVIDAPEGADVTRTATEDTPYNLHALDFGFGDVDGNSLSYIVLSSAPLHGRIVDLGGYEVWHDIDGDGTGDLLVIAPERELTVGAVLDPALMSLGYIVYIPAANANGTAADSFTYQVVDNGDVPGSAGTVDPTPNTLTFNIGGVNDVPDITDLATTLTINEGDAPTLFDADVTFSDPEDNFDGGSLLVSGLLPDDEVAIRDVGTDPGEIGLAGGDVTFGGVVIGSYTGGIGSDLNVTFNAAATAASIEALIENLTFTSTGDAPVASRDITIAVTDNLADTVSRTVTVEVTAVNDAPVMDLDVLDLSASGNDAAQTYGIGGLPVTLAPQAGFTDVDNTSFDGATLTVSLTAGGTTGDQLRINNIGTGTGEISVSGNTISYEGVEIATFTGGTDGTDLTVTFNADACHCAVQTVMGNVNFQVIGTTPDLSDRTIGFTFTDGAGTANGGADTATAEVTVDVSAPPRVHISAPGSVAVGGEFLVNTTTLGEQSGASAAVLGDGSFVVAWAGSDGVYFQQYDADGTPFAGETRLDDGSVAQFDPAVIALADGGFAMVYLASDGLNPGEVFLQRYDSAGNEVGDAILVGSGGDNRNPQAAVLTNGGIAITWQSDGSDNDVHARLLDSTGAPVTAEFTVNTFTANDQTRPQVAALADGGFLIVWTSSGQDGGGAGSLGVYSQSYDSHGIPVGSEFRLNTTITGSQQQADVAGLDGLGVVMVWNDVGDIVMRFRDPVSGSLSAELAVDTGPTAQNNPAVTRLDDGGYVVTWVSAGQDGDAGGIYAQRYDRGGSPRGSIVLVNTTTAGNQTGAEVTELDDGYLITWSSADQDGDLGGVYAQRYLDSFTATEELPLSLKGHIHVSDLDPADVVTVTLSVVTGALAVDPGTSGVTVDQDPFFLNEVTLTGTAAQIEDLLNTNSGSTVTYTADSDFPPPTDTFTVTIDDGVQSSTDTAQIAITPVNDAPEVELDFFEPATTTWTEGDGPTLLAPGVLFDDDNDSHGGATLTVAIDGATSGDQLTIQSVGTGIGELSVSGFDVLYEGVVVGTWSGGANGDPLVVTFNDDACYCSIELAMASVLYENSDDLTAASTRSIDFTFVDGGGTANGGDDTTTATVDLDVLPFASVIAGPDATGDEDTAIALTGVAIDGLAADPATDVIVVRLRVEHGTLDIRDDVSGGLAAGDIAGSGTDTLVLTGTQDAINATLAAAGGLTYQGDPEFSGADELAIDAHVDTGPSVPFAFTPTGALPIGVPVFALDVLDIDGDGIDDFVLGVDGMLAVLSSTGPGVLPLPDGATPLDFAFADFDGDGAFDVGFTALSGFGNFLAYFSTAAASIVAVADIGASYDLTAGDFNGDGLIDFAAADYINGTVTIVLQDGLGGFEAPAVTATGAAAYSLVVGDFTGDGVLDLVVGNVGAMPGPVAPGSVDLLVGNGDGTFAPAASLLASAGAMVGEVIAADFNEDGALDLAFAYFADLGASTGGVQVMLGNGDGSFSAPTVYQTTTAGAPARLIVADLNGDGTLDLAVVNQDVPGTISVLGGNADGSFAAPVDFATSDSPIGIAAGDADGDGDLDLIVSTLEGGGVLDFLNNDTDTVFREVTGSKNITVDTVDDAAVAVDDSTPTVAADDLVNIAVLANDGDVDGPAVVIATVNGQALTAGQTTTLASGAIVELLADGTLTYDPAGRFDHLVSPATALATGASNGTATDSFTYTLDGGASATVTVTVLGVDGPGDELLGTPADDVITGTGGNDVIRAFGTDDVLAGGDGDDVIYGNNDADTLSGDAGADRLYGGNGDDLLQGGGDNDVLIGNLGDDTMQGGLGDDTYYVGEAGDVVIENFNEGTDTVRSQIDYTLTDNVERLFIGGAARSGTGNALDNGLFGSDSSNTLSGLAGDDILRGGGGRDVLLGGDGADLIDGGVGKDTLTGGAGRDVFQFRDGDMGATRPLADVITDFSQADNEKIQLSLIDADTDTGGNQAFAFVGTAAFSGTAGELRYDTALGNTWISADTDGDGAADWYLGLTGTHVLTATDFTL